ncbi:hypothetical protein GPECTOR_1g589 [Gonium pectorale]|uniref:tRNA/rRNA methyltransferase SpoU type domain-containing protein n=1 Tax=Gonium pectorale TaxID=33097 RepID=A0A150H3N8_GONPE|nr:hypothetical protein GPECTOR_1g589 [Gonium pectorale]|eukprot:KXZ56653.1 hypothetical protein GPECTOR_1g589 [Gonium pectorale]
MQSLVRRQLASVRYPCAAPATHLLGHRRLCTRVNGKGVTSIDPVHRKDVGFPYSNNFVLDGRTVDAETVVRLLEPFALEDRVQRIESVVANRTYNVLPIVEALGYGAVHCINKSDNKYKVSQRTAAGADKWLDVRFWNSTTDCIAAVKAAGYQIITTHLSQSSITIQEVDWTKPTAFILGNEKHGVSAEAVAAADACAIIPMVGMVESFNISVASALILYEAQQQRIRRLGAHADLSEQERLTLKATMLMKTVKESRTVLSELLSRPPPSWQAGTIKALSKQAALYEASVAARSISASG